MWNYLKQELLIQYLVLYPRKASFILYWENLLHHPQKIWENVRRAIKARRGQLPQSRARPILLNSHRKPPRETLLPIIWSSLANSLTFWIIWEIWKGLTWLWIIALPTILNLCKTRFWEEITSLCTCQHTPQKLMQLNSFDLSSEEKWSVTNF